MNKAYFIGIGGIGVSALARKYLAEGWQVSGSDRSRSLVTDELEQLGVSIYLQQEASNVPSDASVVIYTIALSEDHPELARARELGLRLLSYPEALGELTRTHQTVAVAGTHGKTTTTAMIAQIALDAGLDPTVVVGSFLLREDGSKTNFIAGQSKLLIVEACEYRRSFLNLQPEILVITNIDNDHLDYYRDLDDIKSAFAELVAKVPAGGKVITEKEYSQMPGGLKLKVPGAHNIRNAQAALAVAEVLGVPREQAVKSLEGFVGTWRRFEYKGALASGAKVYDDYAHHPSEIKATLAGAREVTKGQLWAIFQPHLYSRTKLLFSDFANSFVAADKVLLTDIYAAREPADPAVSSRDLAQAIGEKARYCASLEQVAQIIQAEVGPDDLVLMMGAGDIYHLADTLL